MIEKPVKAARRIRVSTYDLEWSSEPIDSRTKEHKVLLCGAYDERGYRAYTTVRAFLAGELTPENSGRHYYAHFGGASDMVFLLKELIRDESVSIKAVYSSSSAIVVTIQKDKLRWTFVDSFWLLRTKLANIAKFVGMEKGDLGAALQDRDGPIMREYNERDCVILYKAIELFQELIISLGGELGVTAASTAMRTFLRCYLSRPIDNSKVDDSYVRAGYVASRVEVIRKVCELARSYDINSSFPFSMTWPCPGTCIAMGRRLPSKGLWFADATISVPSDNYLPTVPWRSEDGRIFFPSGRFRTILSSEDMLAGGFEIEKVWSVRAYEDRDDLRAYAEHFYALRRDAAPDGFEREVYKILLNALYGKFAERGEKEGLLIRPKRVDVEALESGRWELIAPHMYRVVEDVMIPHSHVPISAMITSRSRRLLLEHARESARLGRLYYCDTDSVVTDAKLPTSSALGGLKLEREIVRGQFVAPKLYAVEDSDGKSIVKAKGFSRVVGEGGEREPLSYAAFSALVEGESAEIERMLRTRELLRLDGARYTPRTVRVSKRIHPGLRPKRFHLPNGDSRPWSVAELSEPPA